MKFYSDEELAKILDRGIFHKISLVADRLGVECYVVGGYVRDIFLERKSGDIDVVVVGNGILVLCNIRLKQHTQALIQEFMDAVQSIDEITECYNPSGDFDFLIKVYTRDMKAYQQFMLNTLGTIPCVGSLNSIFVIDQTKSTRGVPIPENEDSKSSQFTVHSSH